MSASSITPVFPPHGYRTGAEFPPAVAGDPRRMLRRRHGGARPDRDRHGPADDRRRAEGLRSLRLGRHLVSALLDHRRADLRQARRRARPQALRPRRHPAVHRRLDAVRPGAGHAGTGAGARPAGHRRRHAGRHRLRHRRGSVPGAARTAALAGAAQRRLRPRQRLRPHAGRIPDRILGLALGILCQPAGGRREPVVRVALSAADPAQRPTPPHNWTGRARR